MLLLRAHTHNTPLLPAAAGRRGLTGPESSSDDEEDEEDEEGAQHGGSGSSEEEPGSEDDAEGSEEEDSDGEAVFRQRRPLVPPHKGGAEEEGEEPLRPEDLEEWGVGALAANPEEQARRRQLERLQLVGAACRHLAPPCAARLPTNPPRPRSARYRPCRSRCCPTPRRAWRRSTWIGSTCGRWTSWRPCPRLLQRAALCSAWWSTPRVGGGLGYGAGSRAGGEGV